MNAAWGTLSIPVSRPRYMLMLYDIHLAQPCYAPLALHRSSGDRVYLTCLTGVPGSLDGLMDDTLARHVLFLPHVWEAKRSSLGHCMGVREAEVGQQVII
jgi:hypothetical protein